jgi:predicted AAA+ superfamily ATPase
MNLIPRAAEPTIRRLAGGFPVVALVGPRQSGKTTLARAVFPDRPYVSLEDPEERAFALADPRGFLARFADGAVLDEVQRAPDLFSYLQGMVDQRGRMGEFVLTGSQQFGLVASVTQSLAGRVGLVNLLPLSQQELAAAGRAPRTLEEALWRGGYPALHARRVDPPDWFANYVATYLERDLRQVLTVRDLGLFQRFLKMCAARTGQLLNLSALAADCGITHPTARQWITVLQASGIVHLLPPYHRNFGKRLVQTPKIYFLDAGLAGWLLGVRDDASLATHAARGPLFESWVVAEFIKHAFNRGQSAELYFWRDSAGHEVDLLRPVAGRLQPIEIKSGATFAADWLSSLQRWCALTGSEAAEPGLIHGGTLEGTREGVRLIRWTALGRP